MQPYMPLATLYAATALRDNGISVAAFDPMLEEPSHSFLRALAHHRPAIVAVYEDDFNFREKIEVIFVDGDDRGPMMSKRAQKRMRRLFEHRIKRCY